MQTPTRRDVLRNGSGVIAGGIVTGLAGCSSLNPLGGGAAVTPKQWLVAPGTFTGQDHYYYAFAKPKAILQDEDELSDSFKSEVSTTDLWGKATGIDAEKVTSSLGYLSGQGAIDASFSTSEVKNELEDNEFEEEGTQNGYTIYVGSNNSRYAGRAIGVGSSTLVVGRRRGSTDAQEAVETIIDVGRGNEETYAEESDAMRKLLNTMGGGEWEFGGTQNAPEQTNVERGRFEGNVANGFQATINGKKTEITRVFVFEDADSIDTDDIKDWVDQRQDAGGTWSNANDVSVNKDGRAVVVTGMMDTDDFTV